MADRFYINTTNLVTFAAGERPSADKFNAVNKYFSRGLESLAKVIGDAHDNGAPHGLRETQNIYLTNKWNKSSSKNRPLDILNLARLIGPASNLNPRYLHRSTTSSIDEVIPEGVLEYYTNFPLGSVSTNLSEAEIDFEKSMIRFPEETTGEVAITYSTKGGSIIEGGPNYVDAEFNVIPDPNTPETEADYNLTITETLEGDYIITLPTTGYQQSKLLNRLDTNIDTSDPNNNLQIQLPFWMQGFESEQVIPSGSICLKDRTTGESFLNATYTYISLTEVKISSVELCLTEDHVFCLITVGTDITTSIDDIRTKLFMHKHDGSFGESRISIYDLKDVFKYAPPSGPYKESEIAWNAIPQYLHRDGWQEGQDSFNGDNGMRGPLMMNVTSEDGVSNSIYFGEINKSISSTGNYLSIQSHSTGLFENRGVRIAAVGSETNLNGIEVTSATNINSLASIKINNNNCQKYYFNNINNINKDDIFPNTNKNIIENAGSFNKDVLEDQHLYFDISLQELESLVGVTFDVIADELSANINGEYKVIFKKVSNQNILIVDINFFKNIDSSNIKDLYKYLVNSEDAEIDFLDYKGALTGQKRVLLSLSSKNPNARYRLDLRTKIYTVNVNSVDYDYQVNLFNKIDIMTGSPLSLSQGSQESLYLVIDRFKNYYNLIESEICNYESTFEIFLQRDPESVAKNLAYIFFNYNGCVEDGEYLGAFHGYETNEDLANKILVEKIFIELDTNNSLILVGNNLSTDGPFPYLRITSGSDKMKLICKEYFDHNLKQVVLTIKAVEDNASSSKVYSRPLIT
jgi:hypothetical protein